MKFVHLQVVGNQQIQQQPNEQQPMNAIIQNEPFQQQNQQIVGQLPASGQGQNIPIQAAQQTPVVQQQLQNQQQYQVQNQLPLANQLQGAQQEIHGIQSQQELYRAQGGGAMNQPVKQDQKQMFQNQIPAKHDATKSQESNREQQIFQQQFNNRVKLQNNAQGKEQANFQAVNKQPRLEQVPNVNGNKENSQRSVDKVKQQNGINLSPIQQDNAVAKDPENQFMQHQQQQQPANVHQNSQNKLFDGEGIRQQFARSYVESRDKIDAKRQAEKDKSKVKVPGRRQTFSLGLL